jgi:hypothetical protein
VAEHGTSQPDGGASSGASTSGECPKRCERCAPIYCIVQPTSCSASGELWLHGEHRLTSGTRDDEGVLKLRELDALRKRAM